MASHSRLTKLHQEPPSSKRAVEPLGEYSLGVGRHVVGEEAVVRCESRDDQIGDAVGARIPLYKALHHRSDRKVVEWSPGRPRGTDL